MNKKNSFYYKLLTYILQKNLWGKIRLKLFFWFYVFSSIVTLI